MKCTNCGFEFTNDKVKFCPKCGTKVEQTVVPVQQNKSKFAHDISAVWPQWQIEKQIGRGSYGVVYQAVRRDNNIESHAAIKVISIPSDSSEVDSLRSEGLDLNGTRTYFKGIVDDFVSEIQLMESLKGIQNIVSVEDYRVVEKTDSVGYEIYIRMELLTPFNTYICDKNLTEKEVVKIGVDICTALEICGKRNIIHRDIKPENIFVNDFGYFKLGDFGIARKLENMTSGLSQKGTFNYMAPEVVNSKAYDSRVDTYSLGIVLYRLLNNNKLPFLDTDKQILNANERKLAVERRIRGDNLMPPKGASAQMANLILKACAFDPNARFTSATEMKNALLKVENGTYIPTVIDPDQTVSVTSSKPVPAVAPTPAPFKAQTVANKSASPAPVNEPVAPPIQKQPQVNTFTEKPKKKAKKGKVIAISVLSGILALFILAGVLFFTSPAYSVYSNIKSDKCDKAVSEYNRDVKGNFIQEAILDILLKDRVNKVATDYQNGKLKLEDAIEQLTALDEMGFEGAKTKADELTSADDAVNALEKANEYYEAGDYKNAIAEYSKIPEGDKNYETAQSKLNKSYEGFIDSTVTSAQAFSDAKKYKEALKEINAAYDILPDSVDTKDLDTVKEETLALYQAEITSEVDELVEDDNFDDAFALIDEAIAVDSNDYFTELKATTEGKYVEHVTGIVEDYLDDGDYISAQRVADNATTKLPDNEDLEDLSERVEKETPTYLLDVCKPYSTTEGYTEYINGETISMGGDTYTNGFTIHYDGYAIFNLDSDYTNIGVTLGHQDDTDKSDATIKIYCDDVLKKEIKIGHSDLPQRISIDVTGVKQIKFVRDSGWYGNYGFMNLTVK